MRYGLRNAALLDACYLELWPIGEKISRTWHLSKAYFSAMQLKDDKVFWLEAKASFVHCQSNLSSLSASVNVRVSFIRSEKPANLCSLSSLSFYFVCLLIEAPKALHSLDAPSPQLATQCC